VSGITALVITARGGWTLDHCIQNLSLPYPNGAVSVSDDEELHNSYSWPNVIRIIKSRRM